MEIQIGVNMVGVALLVSNDYKGQKKPLPFVHKDADNLERVFKQFSYTVYRKRNVTDTDFLECYRDLADYNYPPTCKRILVYFTGHGGSDGVLAMQNGNCIKIEDIIHCFKTGISKSKTVPHMVKMFFFDACRGGDEDVGYLISKVDDNDKAWMGRIPKEGGTLVAYASTPLHIAYGDSSGSQWTNCLVQALEESEESHSVYEVLTHANKLMKEHPAQTQKGIMFQTPEFTTNLTELVYFKKEAAKKVTTPMRDYTKLKALRDYAKIKQKNCQLLTHYGGKKFNCPCDVTIGPKSEIVIAHFGNREVTIFDKDLKLMRTFGQGRGDSTLRCPEGVAVGQHVIAVSEFTDHVVKKYSLRGDYLSKFGSRGCGHGQFFFPRGLCFNSKDLLYVVDTINHRIQVFSENNVFLFKFGSEGHNPGQFQEPRYIAMDSRDQVYVTDFSDDGGICVFSEDGHFIKKINCNKPWAIGIAPDDYIITNPKDVLTVFDPTHKLITKFGVHGKEKGEFGDVRGIAINSSGTIFVTEFGNHRLQIIAS